MTIKQFIEKAIEGGWPELKVTLYNDEYFEHAHQRSILLSPVAWRAVGKVEGWKSQTGGQ